MPLTESDLWLEIAARFSIVASVLVVMYFFVFTAWRITRFPNNNPWPWTNSNANRKEIHQTPTQMPFTFTLDVESLNDVNKLNFNLECQEQPRAVRLLWGIDASYLYKIIHHSSWEVVQELENTKSDDVVDSDNRPYLFADSMQLEISETEKFNYKGTVFTPKKLKWEDLNNQYKYPLAIFILKSTRKPLMESISSIVGLCIVIHVKNPSISKPTSILAQYIKLLSGQAYMLQPLFVMDGEVQGESSAASINHSENLTDNRNQPFRDVICSVCQTLPVSRAIIPCRHVCLCAQCFGKVKSCPFCRGPISYFFKTRSESYMENIAETNEVDSFLNDRRPWGEILTTLNDNVNTAFGFDE